VDYVVLHELAHSRHMNHSAAFWRVLESVCPDARERDRVFDRDAARLVPAWARYRGG
ncbi:MAG: M48 family metallopeptidase, partial [Pseudomonadota bacterium]